MADDVEPTLFGDDPGLEGAALAAKAPAPGVARVLMPNRAQVELRPSDLESLLPEGHRARLVWDSVERADLRRMYAGIRAVEGGSVRTAIAPEILFIVLCVKFYTLSKRSVSAPGVHRWAGRQ